MRRGYGKKNLNFDRNWKEYEKDLGILQLQQTSGLVC